MTRTTTDATSNEPRGNARASSHSGNAGDASKVAVKHSSAASSRTAVDDALLILHPALSALYSHLRDRSEQLMAAAAEQGEAADQVQRSAWRKLCAELAQACAALQIAGAHAEHKVLACVTQALHSTDLPLEPAEPDARFAPAAQPEPRLHLLPMLLSLLHSLQHMLDELREGRAMSVLQLFPLYRKMKDLLGDAAPHPAQFFPEYRADTPAVASLHGARGPAEVAIDLSARRREFEHALLHHLHEQNRSLAFTHLQILRSIVSEVARSGPVHADPALAQMWTLLAGCLHGIADADFFIDLYAKQLLGNVNRQLRKLVQNEAVADQKLVREARFLLEMYAGDGAHLHLSEADRQQYLHHVRAVPEMRTLQDAGAAGGAVVIRQGLLIQTLQQLMQVQDAWIRLPGADADHSTAYEQDMARLTECGIQLGLMPLSELLTALDSMTPELAQAAHRTEVSLQFGYCLLFIEHCLNRLDTFGDLQAEQLSVEVNQMVQQLISVLFGAERACPPRSLEQHVADSSRHDAERVAAEQALSVLDAVQQKLDGHWSDMPAPANAVAADEQNSGATLYGASAHSLRQIAAVLEVAALHPAWKLAQQIQQALQRLQELGSEQAAENKAKLTSLRPTLIRDLLLLERSLVRWQRNPASAGVRCFDAAAYAVASPGPKSVTQVLSPTQAAETNQADQADQADQVHLEDEANHPDVFAFTDEPEAASTEPEQTIAAEEVDFELLDVFLIEADEILGQMNAVLDQLHALAAGDGMPLIKELRRQFHTLKGSGRMVGLNALGSAAAAVERVLNQRLGDSRKPEPELLALLDLAAARMQAWVKDLHQQKFGTCDPKALVAVAEGLLGATRDEEAEGFSPMDAPALAGGTKAAEVDESEPIAGAKEQSGHDPVADKETELAAESPAINLLQIGELQLPRVLFEIYTEEATRLLQSLWQSFSAWRAAGASPELPDAMWRTVHTLKSNAAAVRLLPVLKIVERLNLLLHQLQRQPRQLTTVQLDVLSDAIQATRQMLQQFSAAQMPAVRQDMAQALDDLILGLSKVADAEDAVTNAAADAPAHGSADDPAAAIPGVTDDIVDDIDGELLPVFLEEGRDLFPPIGEALQKLRATPGDKTLIASMLRPLHTVKGSARMAGAMRLGQQMHELESRIEALERSASGVAASVEEIDALLAHYDAGLHMFERLQSPAAGAGIDSRTAAAASPAAAPVAQSNAGDTGGTQVKAPTSLFSSITSSETRRSRNRGDEAHAGRPDADIKTPVPLVRIRASVLDQLLNQAGEISISRSHLETETELLRQCAAELADNISKLSTQMREVEIQAEIRIAASDRSQLDSTQFDPLELDRFTHLQELTRMMAESLNDALSLQKTLIGAVDKTQSGLTRQARLTRDLQRELMHARMVQFNSLEERLHRLVRQMAKETGKELELEVIGSGVELDRSILEKMIGPFEHLLRNSAVHGIESVDQRVRAGKPVSGRLRLQVRQEGNEVMMRMSDDGQGLDLPRIRAKAIQQKLLAADQQIGDAQLMDVIFEPGFSTSGDVTALAGRGVGMDVVRSEVTALGGRISIDSQAGQGTRFTMHLPLTLAVTQVTLLSLGRQIYAIPTVLVEKVLQLRDAALEQALQNNVVEHKGRKVSLHELSGLLGEADIGLAREQSLPVIFVKSGNDLVAIMADRVIGNREVVTKHIGPQLSHMVGIVGATILGGGEIVLILNPVLLAQRNGYREALLRPRAPVVADQRKLVMVVDDSLTVRKVTQRLLQRAGYRVLLASDGLDAVQQLQQVVPDIFLVDIEMPRMDGFALVRHLRDHSATAALPIVMITSRAAAKHRARAMALGVNEYLGKPYQDQVLLKLIRQFTQDQPAAAEPEAEALSLPDEGE
ncbi:Hpt domain-containing protein [Herbaspirillum lusitanum]|uniref:histidine kinase n=1 Tax=Herbaspirillum lusitanum TaxID=213312 RepID=A0ABW9ADL1_9BURK